MPDDTSPLTCEEFQRRLADLISCDIDGLDHPHARVCAHCRQLLQDLRTIAEAARYRPLGSDDWSEST
jgi:hypothetical protein